MIKSQMLHVYIIVNHMLMRVLIVTNGNDSIESIF